MVLFGVREVQGGDGVVEQGMHQNPCEGISSWKKHFCIIESILVYIKA